MAKCMDSLRFMAMCRPVGTGTVVSLVLFEITCGFLVEAWLEKLPANIAIIPIAIATDTAIMIIVLLFKLVSVL